MGVPVADTGSVTEDNDVGGDLIATGDIDYLFGDDSGDWTAQTITGAYGSELVIDDDGVWTYTADNSNAAIQALDDGDTLTEVFNVTSTGGASTITITIFGVDDPPCFTPGTLIDTPDGARPVECLRPGDLVLTRDHGPQPVRWVAQRQLSGPELAADPRLWPVEIAKDSLGPGQPNRTTWLSPQHRVLLGGADVELMLAQDEVLCAAKWLASFRLAQQVRVQAVTYVHVLLDRHEVLTANGLPVESFFLGDLGPDAFDLAARHEALRILPELASQGREATQAARLILRGYEARALAAADGLRAPVTVRRLARHERARRAAWAA